MRPARRGATSATVGTACGDRRDGGTPTSYAGRIKPAVQGMIGQLHELSDEPDEVQIEFGLDLHAEAGAFVAQASADANFSVILTWHRKYDELEEPSDG